MSLNLSLNGDWVPAACTLPTTEQPVRIAEFDRFFIEAVENVQRVAKTRLDLLIDSAAEPWARDLAARETGCCSFFTFTFKEVDSGVVMGVEVPSTQVEVLDALAARVRCP